MAKKLARSTRRPKIASVTRSRSPWTSVFRLAANQDGLFSARQATELGCSQQLLGRYIATGKVERVDRAVYRITDFPPGDHEDLIMVALWGRNEGVFSHETALLLHELSDVLPNRTHLTLPLGWKARRVQIPKHVVVHYADLPDEDRTWIGNLRTTSVRRTLSDCLQELVAPELVAQASLQAAERGLIGSNEVLSAPLVNLWRSRLHP
jgi:predicted transcriptional regulator of viral defense system